MRDLLLPLLLGGLLALAAAGVPPARAAADAKAIAGAVDRVFASGRYQTEMPAATAAELPQIRPLTIPEGVIRVLRILFWAFVIVGVVLVLAQLVNAAPSLAARLRRRAAKGSGQAGVPIVADADRERLGDILAEADRLAGAGDFADALHLILLYCVAELRRRRGLGVPAALTSREILRLSALPEAPRAALAVIVAAVELSHFGGRAVDAGTYRSCRRRCEEVLFGGAAG
jgi:hypothetical protein